MSQALEAMMVICFGISWPISIIKSYTCKTAKGKSFIFLLFLFIGYICGVSSKIVSGNITYVFIFYCANLIMVFVDILLYFRNVKIDKEAQDD